ncbi:MAG: hypothetical protein HAW67_04405 [Endozoicomonadaceae bacterium]|nr:hypothetical protein [Endozoicomonadaceae bacterium]
MSLYFASPKQITSLNLDSVGSGTGILRHGFGVYVANQDTAQHYFDEYKHYNGADLRFFNNKIEIQQGTPAYEMALKLADHNFDVDTVAEGLDNRLDQLILQSLVNVDNEPKIESVRAYLYEINERSLPTLNDWEDIVSTDFIDKATMLFYQNSIDFKAIDTSEFENLGVDTWGVENNDFRQLCEDIFEAAYDQFESDYDHLLGEWFCQIRGYDSYSQHYDDLFEAVDVKYFRLINSITGSVVSLPNDISFGDLYQHFSYCFNPDEDQIAKNNKGMKLASKFFESKLSIEGLTAPAFHSEKNAKETVLFSQKLLTNLIFKDCTEGLLFGDDITINDRPSPADLRESRMKMSM